MSQVSITAELLGENKSGAAFADMSADIKALDKELDRLEREIRVGLSLDDRASAEVKAAGAALDKWDGRDATATIRLDDKASGGLRSAFAYLDSWDESDATATIDVRDLATAKIASILAEARKVESLDPTVEVDADTAGASAGFAKTGAEAAALGRLRPTVDADADTAAATAKIAALDAKVRALAKLRPTVTVDVDDGGAVGEIGVVSAAAERLDGKDIDLDVDVDTAGATAQLVAFQATAVGTTAATQGLTKSMVGLTSPLVLGALVPLVVGAAAAVGPLAAGLAVAGTAGIAAAAGFGLLAGAIAGPIAEIAKFKEAQKGQEAATNAAAAATKSYESAQQSLADAQKGVITAERGVADARRSAAQGVTAAEEGYEEALRGVADAQRGVKEAESGVHEAVRQAAQDVTSAEEGYRDALRGVVDAQRQVKDAERGVHEAQKQAAEGVADAEAGYEDALRAVADAQREVQAAERGVADARRQATLGVESATDAYRDSLEAVEDSEEALSDSRGGLEDATQDVVEAQKDLNEALEDEPRNIAGMELGVKEARLQQAQATQDVTEAQKDLNAARRSGDPDEVRQAELDLRSARLSSERASLDEADAEDDLSDARKKGTSELQSAREGYKSSLEARRDAAKGVQDSEEALADSQRDAAKAEKEIQRARAEGARSVKEAQRGVAEAQRGVADAQRAALAAEKEISRARAEGARQVRDAQRQVADAQRGVATAQRAALASEKEISRARAEGARGIKEAQRGAADAQRALADSQRDAAKAEQEIARARKEGARQVKEAQRGVADAQRAAARASDEVADAAQAMAKAQKEAAGAGGVLSAANRRLLGSFEALGPAYKKSFKGANEEAADLGAEILGVAKGALPALGDEAEETVRGVRRAFSGLRSDLGGREKDSLNTILDSSSDIIEDLVRAGGRTFGGLSNTIAEIVPHAKDFAQYLSDVSEDFLKWSRTEDAREDIQRWVKTAKPLFKELAENTGDFLGFLISFGNKHSDDLVDALDLVTDSLDALFGGKEQKTREKDAGKAGAMTGSAYSDKFVEAQNKAAKSEGDGIGERWGAAIGKGIGNLSQWILNADKRNNSGEPAGKGFGKGFLKGVREAFDDYDFKDSELYDLIRDAQKRLDQFGDWVQDRWKKSALKDLLDFGDFKDSELYDLLQDGEKRLDQFGNWLEKWGGRIEKWLIDPFSSAYDKIIGNSIVPDLADDVTDVFGKLPGRIGDALKSLPGKVGDVFRDAYDKGSGYLGDLAKSADEKTGDAQKWMIEHLTGGKTEGLKQLGILKKDGTLDLEGLRKAADEQMDSARKWVGDHLSSAKTKGVEALGALKSDGTSRLEDLRKGADDKTDSARQAIKDHLETAKEVGVAALGSLRDKGGEAMSAARDKWTDPVKGSSTDQQGFMNNMLYGMGQVIEKAGLDLKKPEQFAVLSKPGGADQAADKQFGRPTGLATGGILDADGIHRFAGGGVSGPRQPKIIEWGEGDHEEVGIFVTRDPSLRRENEHYASAAADLLGGAFVSQAQLAAGAVKQAFARGGMVEVGGGLFAKIPERQAGSHGTTEPGSAEERLLGRRWATYGAGGSGSGLPPLGNIGPFFGPDGILRYTATPQAAPVADAGAAMWKGQVQKGTGGSRVSMGELGGATRGMAYDSGAIVLDYQAQPPAAAHEYAHHFQLGHGGYSIVGGAGFVTDNDFAALSKYHGISPGDSDPMRRRKSPASDPGEVTQGRPHRTGRGGDNFSANIFNISQSGGGSQSVGGRSGMIQQGGGASLGDVTSRWPGWLREITGMAEGGVLPGVPVWREDDPSERLGAERLGADAGDPAAQALLRNPPTWRMKGLVPRGTGVGSGEGLGATMHTYIPEMDAYRKGVESAFPDISTNTYSNHPMGFEQPYYRERSIDHWGGGGRGDPIPTATGDKVAAYAIDKIGEDLNWLIWNGQMLDAGGWGPDTSGFSHAGAQAHDHVTAFANSSKADTAASGGPSGIDIGPMIDRYIKEVPDWGKGLPPDSAENITKQARAAIVARLTGAAGAMSSGEYSGGGDLDKWITDGFKFGNAFEDTADNHSKMKARAMQESGGDPEAVNNWDVNAQNNTPSKGLVQVIEPEWELRQTQYGEDAGPFEPNWKNPVKSVGIGSRRMKAVYGEVLGDTGQGYKGGGYIRKDHAAQVHKDELYFPLGEDPRAATEFMGFLKNLAPKGFDSAEMRSEYERRIAGFEGRGGFAAAADGPGGAPGGAPGSGGRPRRDLDDLAARFERSVEGQTTALLDRHDRQMEERLEEVDVLIEGLNAAMLRSQASAAGAEIQTRNRLRQKRKRNERIN